MSCSLRIRLNRGSNRALAQTQNAAVCGGPDVGDTLAFEKKGHGAEDVTWTKNRRLRTPVLSREPPSPSLACTGHGEECRMGL